MALEAEVKALREKAEKWDILEKTSKGILTDNYYKMKIKAEVAEAEVKALGEQLEVTARLGGEQARGAIYLNHQLIKAESRLAEAEKDSKEWEKQYRKLRESIMNIVFPPQTELSRSIDNFKPEEEKALHGVNVCETCIHFEKMEKLEYAWCPHKGDFLYENHLVCGDYIKRGVGGKSEKGGKS